MTQQTLERLRYRGRIFELTDYPLRACDVPEVRERMQDLMSRSTAQWRGYRGTWEVRGRCLWLIGLSATVRGIDKPQGLSWLFPDSSGPVLAEWFTGELQSPRGKAEGAGQYRYEHPALRVFHIERGHVVKSELRSNLDALKAARLRQANWLKLLESW